MQIIVNCVILIDDQLVLLQKPRRGWWVAPGGKVEPSETWVEAVRREFWEETGLTVSGLHLRGIHRIWIGEGENRKDRIIAQFSASTATGTLLSESKEGILDKVGLEKWENLPMDDGDRIMIRHTLDSMRNNSSAICFGKFVYTEDHALITWEISDCDVPVGAESTSGAGGDIHWTHGLA
ncbi:NUDIX domain-containing protein [Alicyclobacillus ferrooxydans]|uniref:Nudix hydrolase domain-containing protein n=1 Tax=Alicyclobacillus ferrooxydans TaxID=471514 RepID=A0A0P9D827_9BACL|nr:NUDIX domain-containing protein [Alicyclobacillus ferrooxydans]KPV45451.1 hypothetical protein AN477_00280 [Alicyclobacillus ferrooxydans]